MKSSIRVHLSSAALGAALTVVCGMAARSPQTLAQAQAMQLGSARCAIIDPRKVFSVTEGDAYVVPSGQRLVVTGLGSVNPTIASVVLFVDGAAALTTHTETPTTIRETPAWFSVPAGKTISVSGGDATLDARVFGYLIAE